MSAERDGWNPEEYERQVLENIRDEANDQNPVLKEFKYRNFVSRSAGRGRTRRPRQIELVGRNGEFTSIKDGYHSPIDQWADEWLGDSVTNGTDTYDEFLRLLRLQNQSPY